jgi:peptide/nickel transport system substrate-binding protein
MPIMRRTIQRLTLAALAAASGAVAAGPAAWAQSVTIVREIDSDRYDPHRSTARAASEVLFMLADTLVSLDYDMKTIKPGLAETWSMAPDGLTYTFNLRKDVKFCDGKPMKAEDVAYSLNRWINPETKSPVKWRAGKVESIAAKDDYTLEYKLKSPFSELLYQLTQSFAVVIDKETVDKLGPDFGVKGFNGTGPFCWVEWTPRNEMKLKRNDAYTWGPPIYENRGPAHVKEITWKVVPEENTRLAALMTGQTQVTQYIPYSGFKIIRSNPNTRIVESKEAFWTYFMGFKIDRPFVNDEVLRKAMVMAVDQAAIAKNLYFGEVEPAYSYISQQALDWNKGLDDKLTKTNVAAANKLLDDAGYTKGADGFRVKDGKRIEPLLYTFAGSTWTKLSEAVQGDLRKIGVDLKIQPFDATVVWGKLAKQEYEVFSMSFPYISAGDALNLYFPSTNMPSPNRMNWKDARTDELLAKGMGATTDDVRAAAYGEVLERVHKAAVWIPLYHEPMKIGYSAKLAPIKAHNIYGCGLYKGLDLKYVK